MKNDLQHQQGLLWELYKAWVRGYSPDGSSKEEEMYRFYEQLNLLLTSLNPPLNPNLLINPIEKHFGAVISFIADVVGPEKIFCLNHRSCTDGTIHANLILVLPEKSSKTFDEIETILDFACLKHHHLSCSLFKASFFEKMIAEGHIYFSLACDSENLIYDSGVSKLPKIQLDNSAHKIEETKQEFFRGMEKAQTFYIAAEGYRNNNLTMAAFMLHQAVELCLRALSKSLIGQEKTTHSLKALLKFNMRISTKLTILMNNDDAEDERLLVQLEGAYLGYRYSEKYSISESDFDILFEKVKNLHHCTKEIFMDWIAKYSQLA